MARLWWSNILTLKVGDSVTLGQDINSSNAALRKKNRLTKIFTKNSEGKIYQCSKGGILSNPVYPNYDIEFSNGDILFGIPEYLVNQSHNK